MKVSQLIEALRHMPAEAEITTWAESDRFARGASGLRVAHVGTQVVVGDWNGKNLAKWLKVSENGEHGPDVYSVRLWEHDLLIEKLVGVDVPYPYDDTRMTDWRLLTSEERERLARAQDDARMALEEAERRELERLKAKYEEG